MDENNTNLLSYHSGDKKSEMSLLGQIEVSTGLCFLWGFRGESDLCLWQLLEAACIPRLVALYQQSHHSNLCSCYPISFSGAPSCHVWNMALTNITAHIIFKCICNIYSNWLCIIYFILYYNIYYMITWHKVAINTF